MASSTRFCSASPAPARPSPWPRSSKASARPALVLAHNKTLAAQLYHEFKSFFPSNAVEYFVSYYDYYQPEAYIPSSDVYIEKEATINDELDKLRLAATQSLFERRDCVIVASVSCIYGLGSPEAYYGMLLMLEKGQKITREQILPAAGRNPLRAQRRAISAAARSACAATSSRSSPPTTTTPTASSCGATRSRACRQIDPLLGQVHQTYLRLPIYPKTHYVMSEETREQRHDVHPNASCSGGTPNSKSRASWSRRSASSSAPCSTSR